MEEPTTDDRITQMYNADVPISQIVKTTGVDRRGVYRRLRANDIEPNRKTPSAWTPVEEYSLFCARRDNCTGQELTERITTRTLDAIKGHLAKMRLVEQDFR